MFKRVTLFLLTNLFIIATVSIITSVLGLHSYLTAYGIDYTQLALFCIIWGFSGSFISLFLSKFMAKMAMGVVIIDPRHATREEHFLLDIIYELAKKLKLEKMPEVGIYHSPELNAFATGPSKNNALVAVSSGLLAGMTRDEIEGVLGHEMSHIVNGDMVTMTLLQGLINSFSLFLSRIIAYAISIAVSRSESDGNENVISYGTYMLVTIILDVLFTILGSLIVAAYSRRREYRADLGGARLIGRDKMIDALKRLQSTIQIKDDRAPSLAAFKIAHKPTWFELFSSHPPLEKRIQRLEHTSIKS